MNNTSVDIKTDKTIKVIFYSCCFIMLISGVAKTLTGLTAARINEEIDPMLGLQYRILFICVGGLECAIAISPLIFATRTVILLIGWLTCCFGCYRFCGYLTGTGPTCPCLGGVDAVLHWKPGNSNTVSFYLFMYLLISVVYLLLHPTEVRCETNRKD
jgi:hypothetical protein